MSGMPALSIRSGVWTDFCTDKTFHERWAQPITPNRLLVNGFNYNFNVASNISSDNFSCRFVQLGNVQLSLENVCNRSFGLTVIWWGHGLLEQELLTLPGLLSPSPVCSGVRVTRSLVLCVCFRSLFVLLSFFFLPLCCLSVFDLRILITPLISLNSSKIN